MNNCGSNSVEKLFAKIGRLMPQNVVVLSCVKMNVAFIIVAATPDHWQSERHTVSRLEIHTRFLQSDVSHHKTGATNFTNYAIANFFIVLHSIHAKRFVLRAAYSGFDPF